MRSHAWNSRKGRDICVRHTRLPILCASALFCLGTTLPASAQTQAQTQAQTRAQTRAQTQNAAPPRSSTVVSLDNGDIVIDLGSNSGAQVGDVVELWRPLKLRHPVSGKWLEDRFRIGSLVLIQVGATLTLAQPQGSPSRPPQPGDIVLIRSAAKLPANETGPVAVPAPASAAAIEAQDPEAQHLSQMFDGLRGSDPRQRIQVYEQYVRVNPTGRFSVVLYEEAQALRRLFTETREQVRPEPTVVSFQRPQELLSDSPVSIGVETSEVTAGAVLHLRTAGDGAFQSLPMVLSGPGYWTAKIDGTQVRAPNLEYFIEATSDGGHPLALIGDAERPESVSVRETPRPEPPKRREATFSVLTDYADYNRLRSDDYAWQTEGYFGLRYQDVGIRAFRTGFGVYRGVGGTLEDLDDSNKGPRRIGLTYGYLELELGVSSFVSLIGRGAVGLEDEGTTGGGQAMIRVGNDKSTNLMLGGEFLGGVGLRGFTQLELHTFERVPILLRSEVTNQPAGVSDNEPRPADKDASMADTSQGSGDLGARGIVQVGYRVIPTLTIAGRLSYQGRTIKHAGPGLGAAVTYDW